MPHLVTRIVTLGFVASLAACSTVRTSGVKNTSKTFSTVVVDAGHGGKDSGAYRRYGPPEKMVALDVAQRLKQKLRESQIKTVMTRDSDVFIPLNDRVAMENKQKNAVFVSIHFNEDNKPLSSGVETYYAAHQITAGSFVASWLPFLWRPLSDSPNYESQTLAGFIQEALVARTGAVDRGTIAKQFFVIANVTSPAVLIEGGFLTNKEDISKVASEDYREQIAAAVTEGILRYRDAAKQRQSTLAVTDPGKR